MLLTSCQCSLLAFANLKGLYKAGHSGAVPPPDEVGGGEFRKKLSTDMIQDDSNPAGVLHQYVRKVFDLSALSIAEVLGSGCPLHRMWWHQPHTGCTLPEPSIPSHPGQHVDMFLLQSPALWGCWMCQPEFWAPVIHPKLAYSQQSRQIYL